MGWAAGVERILLAGEVAGAGAAPPVELFVALEDRSPDGRAGAFGLLAEARAAGLARRWSSPGARSKASSATPTRSARATWRSWATRRRC